MAGQLNISAEKIVTTTWSSPSAAFGTDCNVLVANLPCRVLSCAYTHSTAGSDAGTVYVQLTKDTGTDAPGAGTDLLANNTNNGFDCKGTANTVQYGVFKTTAGILDLARGDRLSLDFAGTTTALAGMTVTVTLLLDIE